MKGVTFSVFRDNFTKANIGLTYKGTTNVAFFSHFNMFTLCSFIFFLKMALKKRDISFVRQTFIGCFPGMFANQMDCTRDFAGRTCWTFHLE